MTPVSEADNAAEERSGASSSGRRPRDAVLGEEYGDRGHGPRRWVIDPIDGTKNYVRGVPVWATLIALMEADEVGYQSASVVAPPALGRRWWAARGHGAFTGRSLRRGRGLHVSGWRSWPTPRSRTPSLHGWEDAAAAWTGFWS